MVRSLSGIPELHICTDDTFGVFNRDWSEFGDATVRLWQLWYLFVATFLKTCFTEAYMFHRNSSPIISVNSLNFVLKQKEGTWVLQETETGKTVLFITLLNLVNLVSYLEVFSTLFLNKKCPIASTSQYEPSRFIHKAQEMFSTRSCLRDYRGKKWYFTPIKPSRAEDKGLLNMWLSASYF